MADTAGDEAMAKALQESEDSKANGPDDEGAESIDLSAIGLGSTKVFPERSQRRNE